MHLHFFVTGTQSMRKSRTPQRRRQRTRRDGRGWLFAAPVAIAAALTFMLAGAMAQEYFPTAATHAVIIDGETGKLLYGKNHQQAIEPASMSKLMTVGVVFDRISRGEITMDTEFQVSERAWRTGGSKMFVLVNDRIRVEDLLKGTLAVSGNDAALVLAENHPGGEAGFVRAMNARAAEWGLKASTFTNPMGLPDPGQTMSVQDIAILGRHLWRAYPDYRYLFGIKEFTWSDITQTNRNPLLGVFDGADGMKTGHTDTAGYGVIGTATRNGDRRFIVVAGLPSAEARAREADRVMGLAFSEFENRVWFEPGDIVATAAVFGGKADNVSLTIDTRVGYSGHRSVLDDTTARAEFAEPLEAPVRKGQRAGILTVQIPGEDAREYPLYTNEKVREIGAFAKLALGLQILFTPPDADEEEPAH